MRFGVAGLGDAFHTFHIHGHRWVVTGPSGKTPSTIEQSVQTEPVSQFEDAKVFGPGTSFGFTLEEGKGLFRADPPHGEWHLHCHVPSHMMHGMTGSLLIVEGGELAFPLPEGQAPPPHVEPPEPPHEPQTRDVHISRDAYFPKTVTIIAGDTVRWINDDVLTHGIWWDGDRYATAAFDSRETYEQTFKTPGTFPYHCNYRDTHAHTGTVVVLASPGAAPVAPAGGAAGPSGGGATAKTHDVSIGSTGFSPSSLTIKAGDSIRWTNKDTSPHSATADDHGWMSPTLPSGKSFDRAFTAKGTVGYHCHIHHEMTASVTVI